MRQLPWGHNRLQLRPTEPQVEKGCAPLEVLASSTSTPGVQAGNSTDASSLTAEYAGPCQAHKLAGQAPFGASQVPAEGRKLRKPIRSRLQRRLQPFKLLQHRPTHSRFAAASLFALSAWHTSRPVYMHLSGAPVLKQTQSQSNDVNVALA